jgi:hypothetical protein
LASKQQQQHNNITMDSDVLPLTMQLPSHDLIDDKDEDAQKQEKST